MDLAVMIEGQEDLNWELWRRIAGAPLPGLASQSVVRDALPGLAADTDVERSVRPGRQSVRVCPGVKEPSLRDTARRRISRRILLRGGALGALGLAAAAVVGCEDEREGTDTPAPPGPVTGVPLPEMAMVGALPGGHISDIAFAPSDPEIAFLAVNVNAMGVWRSDDGGEGWRRSSPTRPSLELHTATPSPFTPQTRSSCS